MLLFLSSSSECIERILINRPVMLFKRSNRITGSGLSSCSKVKREDLASYFMRILWGLYLQIAVGLTVKLSQHKE